MVKISGASTAELSTDGKKHPLSSIITTTTVFTNCFHNLYCLKVLSFTSPGDGMRAVLRGQTFCNCCHVSIHSSSIKPLFQHPNKVSLSNWILKNSLLKAVSITFRQIPSQLHLRFSSSKWQNRNHPQNLPKGPLKRLPPPKSHTNHLIIYWVFSQNPATSIHLIPSSICSTPQSTKLC